MNTELIEYAPDDCVGQFVESLRMAVEGGGGWEDDCPRLGEGDDIPCVDQVPRGFPGDDDQLAALLKEDIGSAKDQVLARPGGDLGDCSHRAGHDDHAVEEGAATGEGCIHRFLAVFDDAEGQLQFPDLLVDHLLRVGGEDEMDLVGALSEMMQDPLEIDRSTGSGGC